jgi:hypothetical protein
VRSSIFVQKSNSSMDLAKEYKVIFQYLNISLLRSKGRRYFSFSALHFFLRYIIKTPNGIGKSRTERPKTGAHLCCYYQLVAGGYNGANNDQTILQTCVL